MGQEEKGFRQLTVWQKAYQLALECYTASRLFPKEETFGLISQLQRAAVGIPANIAEGYERKHRKEYLQFLYIAKGSLGEVETFLSLARDLGYLSNHDYLNVEGKRADVSRLLKGLIRSLA
jgi:four helix bundle protein